MRLYKILIYTIAFFTLLGCQKRTKAQVDVNTVLRQVDSLMRITDTTEFNRNLLKASSVLKQAVSQEPNNNLVRQMQIRTYTFMRSADSVLLIYQDWVKNEPNSLEANLKRGLIYHILKKDDNARKDFDKVKLILLSRIKSINKIQTDKDLNNLLNISFDLFLIGEKQAAYNIISNINKLHPNNARAKNALLNFNNFNREKEISKQVGF